MTPIRVMKKILNLSMNVCMHLSLLHVQPLLLLAWYSLHQCARASLSSRTRSMRTNTKMSMKMKRLISRADVAKKYRVVASCSASVH